MALPRVFVLASVVLLVFLAACERTPSEPAQISQEISATTQEDRLQNWIAQHEARHKALIPSESPIPLGPSGEPVPIPGGLAPGLHIYLPGPVELGFGGLDHEPSTITDFLGFSAIAYLAGTVTASDGNTYDMLHDMRVMRGLYRADTGKLKVGTFAFI